MPQHPDELVQLDMVHLRPLPGHCADRGAVPGAGDPQSMGLGVVVVAFEMACQAREIALYVSPPRSPTHSGRVERLNGTFRREVWECYDGDLDLPTL